jgi:WD40 repeat protein
VECIAYNSAKNILCSGGDDKTIRCWDINMMNCQAIIFDQDSVVLGLDFSQSGTLLLSADEGGEVIVRQADNLHNFIKLMILIRELEKVLVFILNMINNYYKI